MKTICIYHSVDLDGWMSAAIVKHWYKSQPEYIVEMYEKDDGEYLLDFLGYNYGDPIPDLSSYDRVIMCDVSFPANVMLDMWKKLIWIDHHISAIKQVEDYCDEYDYDKSKPVGLRDTKFAACELTWQYFFPNDTVPEIVRLLGMYDSFRHKGTDEEQKVLEFQYGARNVIGSYESVYSFFVSSLAHDEDINSILDIGKVIYQHLCTEAEQVYKNGFKLFLSEEVNAFIEAYKQTGLKTIYRIRKFIAINKERFNPINFRIDYHKDGYDGAACFHYDGSKWKFSLYNDNGEVDVSQIAKQYGGGGHKGAAGFIIDDINKILKFKNNN